MLIEYARVSTQDQTLDLQLDALKKAGCEKVYTDIASGAKAEREGLEEAINYAREGDVLVVWRLDRLGRSLRHLIETITLLNDRKVGFRSLTENIDSTTSGGKLVFHIFGALAEFERDIIRERTTAGLDGLTEPLEEAEADRGTGEDEEGEVDVITALVPDDQPTAAGDPGQGTLDHPPVPAEALAALDPAPGDPGDDAPLPAGGAAAGVVVGLVGVQLLRSPPGPAARPADRRHGVECLLQDDTVVDVGGREQDRQGDALPVHDEVPLAARLAAVGRVR